MVVSIFTRFALLALLCCMALWTEYLNLKVGYGHARLVELSSGWGMRLFYQMSDGFFSLFGEPVAVAQSNAGMTWSIRLLGIPFTDPIALLSTVVAGGTPTLGFALGALVPLGVAVCCGRLFCSYVCPASLVFFAIGRLRRLLSGFFYFPELEMNRGLAWGVLAGGLGLAIFWGHGAWMLILPYFAMGQTIFHGIAFGALSVAGGSLVLFALLDLCLGHQFTCRNLCPTGRLLGSIGSRPLISIRRDADRCVDGCSTCAQVCTFRVDPRKDEVRDCSLCGECAVICPSACLSIGRDRG